MGMRLVKQPLDPRYTGVVIADRRKHRCGMCGDAISPATAILDTDYGDWLCKWCVRTLADIAEAAEKRHTV